MSIQDQRTTDEEAEAALQGAMTLQDGEHAKNGVASAPVTVVDEASSSMSESPLVEKKIKLCGICKEKESKYKCSRCYIPYCSVACSTLHKATHPPLEQAPAPKPQEPPKPSRPPPRPGTLAAAGLQSPFAVLDESKELQALFKQFPRLPSQLEHINTASQRPVEGLTSSPNLNSNNKLPSHHFGRRRREPWTQERGQQEGVKALEEARRAYGKDGEGVREFGRLVLQLMAREDVVEDEARVEQQLRDENMRIIQQLLDSER